MLADLFEVRQTEDRGLGLFARVRVPKGTLIDYRCDLCQRVCGKDDLLAMSSERRQQLMEHTYTNDDGDVVLDCSVGRYMNHSCEANVIEGDGDFDVAVRDIEPGEEATCDYRQYNDPDEGFPCYCGHASCCSLVVPIRPYPEHLAEEWKRKAREATRVLKLPPRFTTGIGEDRIAVDTWQPPRTGELWEAAQISSTSLVVRQVSRLLNEQAAAPGRVPGQPGFIGAP